MFIFAEEKRPKLHQERPDLSDMELTRLLARMWSDLSDKKKVFTTHCNSEVFPLPSLLHRIKKDCLRYRCAKKIEQIYETSWFGVF